MKPVIAIVGRPNVGKSTLFNRLTRSRDAIVADFPGLTRDRHYGDARLGPREFIVIDTGGFEPTVESGVVREMDFTRHAALMDGATQQMVLLVKLLRRLGAGCLEEAKRLNGELQRIEGEADNLILEILKDLYSGKHDPLKVVVLRDLYELLEKVIDRCRDAGNVVFHIVLKNS